MAVLYMSFTQFLRETLQKEYKEEKDEFYNYKQIYREKLIQFRKEKAIQPIDKPSNIARAKQLGYKAKPGIKVVRVRVRKGSGKHKRPRSGRRPKRMGVKKLTRRISIQAIAEQRAAKKYKNLEVLNSYKVGEDGQHHYYEVILFDPSNPHIKSDKELSKLCSRKHKGRAFRGLTSAAKKSRCLRNKGKGAEKVRPSLRAHNRKAK